MDVAIARARRRDLRRESTTAEFLLWLQLRDRRLAGFKFRRQHPLGPFVLDFYCPTARLAIELDGGQHFETRAAAYDRRRGEFLAAKRIAVLRFANNQVLGEMEGVLMTIAFALGTDGPSP